MIGFKVHLYVYVEVNSNFVYIDCNIVKYVTDHTHCTFSSSPEMSIKTWMLAKGSNYFSLT